MSTNPFRRSSLKGFDGSGGSADIPPVNVDAAAIPLSVNTKVPPSVQKHVNFASPPAIPISPVSYPPSPESTRLSPAYQHTRPVLPLPTDYSGAIQHDPFRAEARTDEDDGAIEQALVNAKVNTALAASSLDASKEDAVRDTLSRFATAPKRHVTTAGSITQSSHASVPQRQTMDVDAFKRLLLTGDTRQLSFAAGNSSESSDEADPSNTDADRASLVESETVGAKRKPPPPRPRHGKPVNGDSPPERMTDTVMPHATPPQELAESFVSLNAVKKAPIPPVTRRSQNSTNIRPPSSRNSSSSEIIAPAVTTDSNSKAPPLPRARRPNATNERRPSGDLPPTEEEPDHIDSPASSSRKASENRPPPPPSRNSSKRISVGLTNPPPVPPPRRGRGSSRSSIESQRPSMSHIFNNENIERNSGEFLRAETESRKSLTNSNANDILADLAALQREVDEARTKVTK